MTLRVFLVEDLHGMEGLVRELLTSLGPYEVVATSRTEAEAKLWVTENPGGWDVALLDLVLEQGSGMQVINLARQQNGAAKIAVFSGYASPGIRTHCIALGADAVFDKADTAGLLAWLRDISVAGR